MKLPRHAIARSTVSDLQSAARAQITPGEAAQVQREKYGAIVAGAQAIQDVAAGIAEIQAEEEYTDVTTDWETAVNAIERDVDDMPPELDALGRPTFDPEKVINMELEARKSVTKALHENMKSASAKRRFQKYVAQNNIQRSEQFAAKAHVKHTEFLAVAAVTKITDYVNNEEYDAAREKLDTSLRNGSIGVVKHAEMKKFISTSEEYNYFYGITNAKTFNPEDAEEALNAISEHELKGDVLTLTPKQLGPIKAMLLRKYAANEAVQEETIQTAQSANYLNLVDEFNAGRLTDEDLMTAARASLVDPASGISQADFERLQSDLAKGSDAAFGSAGETAEGYKYFSTEASELMQGPDLIPDPSSDKYDVEYEWDQKYEKFIHDINNPGNGLGYDSRQKLQADVKAARTQILADPVYKGIEKQMLVDVTGFSDSMLDRMMSSMDSQFKDTISVGNEAIRAVRAEALRLGPGKQDQVAAFQKEAQQFYRLKVNNRLLSKVGVKLEYPKEGKIDDAFIEQMQDDMTDWLTKQLQNNPGSAARDIRSFQNAVDELERLNGIDIKSRMSPEEKARVW